MERQKIAERPHWRRQAEALGFGFHTMYGEPYWDETACWRFTLDEIERDIEAPTSELDAMARELVDRVVKDERLLARLAIPKPHWDLARRSWAEAEPSLYGRMDLAYDGSGPAKLLEYNADTPTSVYETAFFQWVWLEEQIRAGVLPGGADQLNSLQERLIEGMAKLGVPPGWPFHLAAVKGSDEDRGTVRYLEDCAVQAGLEPVFIHVEDIGVDTGGQLTDLEGRAITHLFKLYPWEWAMRDAYGELLAGVDTRFVEPPWKAVLSNKGILPLLWQMFPGHPNLLEAHFEDEVGTPASGSWVRKPLYSREGANIEIRGPEGVLEAAPGEYGEEGFVLQAYAPLASTGDGHAVLGSWIVQGETCGLGIREDRSRITRDLSRFVPHWIG